MAGPVTIQYNPAKLYGCGRQYTVDIEAQAKGRGGTRTIDVMSAIRAKVAGRTLGPGDRLPSIRSLAATMGVSPSTVVEAYDRLAADLASVKRAGSPYAYNNAPSVSTTATCATCVFSTISPR